MRTACYRLMHCNFRSASEHCRAALRLTFQGERMTHRNFSLGLVALSLMLGVSSLRAQDSNLPPSLAAPVDTPAASIKPMEPKKTVSFDLTSIDKTADPCTDFYQYSCGNWVKTNPIPSDQPRWGAFNQISERNRYLLYTELERASKPSPNRSICRWW